MYKIFGTEDNAHLFRGMFLLVLPNFLEKRLLLTSFHSRFHGRLTVWSTESRSSPTLVPVREAVLQSSVASLLFMKAYSFVFNEYS